MACKKLPSLYNCLRGFEFMDDGQMKLPKRPFFHDNTSDDVKESKFKLSPETEERVIIETLLETLLDRVHKRSSRKEEHAAPPEKPLPGWVDLEQVMGHFHIDSKLLDKLCFRETLLVSQFPFSCHFAEPTPMGVFIIDIQPAKGNPYKKPDGRIKMRRNKFLVHVSSEFEYDGKRCGSKITAWVDKNLQTLEERRREYICDGDEINERILYTSTQDCCYYLRYNSEKDIYYYPEEAPNLINEAANLILLRYLAKTCFMGKFETSTTYITGELCRSIYICDGPHGGIVNEKKLDLTRIARILIERCGVVHRQIIVMTLQGQIIKHDWQHCDYVLQINPTAVIRNEKPPPNQRLRLDKNWQNDFELMSLFMQKKELNQKRIDNYMDDHPEVKEIVSDYVQYILQLQPEDVIEFTSKYFLNFAPNLIPRSEYFETLNKEEFCDNDFWFYLK